MLSRHYPRSSDVRRVIAGLLIIATACGSAARVAPAPIVPPTTGEISPRELRADLEVFAADSMRGRRTGTDDALHAASYLAARIQSIGLEPAGDSLYMQRIPLQREEFTATSDISVLSQGGVVQLVLGRDVVPIVNLGPGVPP